MDETLKQQLREVARPLQHLYSLKNGRRLRWRNHQAKKLLTSCDVIMGHNTVNDNVTLFYGRKFLKEIIDTGVEREMKKVVVRYDGSEECDELEIFCALVRNAKGGCDYQAYDEPSKTEQLDALCDRLFNPPA